MNVSDLIRDLHKHRGSVYVEVIFNPDTVVYVKVVKSDLINSLEARIDSKQPVEYFTELNELFITKYYPF